MTRREVDGYVTVDAGQALRLCALKRSRLDAAEVRDHLERIADLIRWNPERRYFWRPWKVKPALTRAEAEEWYDREPGKDDWDCYSRRKRTSRPYDRARTRISLIEQAVECDNAATVMLAVETVGWLKGTDGSV